MTHTRQSRPRPHTHEKATATRFSKHGFRTTDRRLVFEPHRLLYHSTLGLRVMEKKKKPQRESPPPILPGLVLAVLRFSGLGIKKSPTCRPCIRFSRLPSLTPTPHSTAYRRVYRLSNPGLFKKSFAVRCVVHPQTQKAHNLQAVQALPQFEQQKGSANNPYN